MDMAGLSYNCSPSHPVMVARNCVGGPFHVLPVFQRYEYQPPLAIDGYLPGHKCPLDEK